MRTAKRRGADAERELEHLLQDEFGFPVHRVAGSFGVDLVLFGIPVEVKRKSTVPAVMLPTFYAFLTDYDCIGGPPRLFFSDITPLHADRIITPAWRALIPKGGLLAIRVPRKGFALFASLDDYREIREFLKRWTGRPRDGKSGQGGEHDKRQSEDASA